MTGNISKSKGFKGDKGDIPVISFQHDVDTGKLYCYADGKLVGETHILSESFATKIGVAEEINKISGDLVIDIEQSVIFFKDLLVYDKNGNPTTNIDDVHAGIFRMVEAESNDDIEQAMPCLLVQNKNVVRNKKDSSVEYIVRQEILMGDGVTRYRMIADLSNRPVFTDYIIEPYDYLDDLGLATQPLSAKQGYVLDQKKADKEEINELSTGMGNHTGNSTIHITSSERTAWNDKYSKSEVDDKLSKKENASNKVSAIDESANDTTYPSTKAVKECVGVMSAEIRQYTSNALKGHASGNSVILRDVSPNEHEMNVKVHGKNLFDYKAFVNFCKNGGAYLGVASESVDYLGEKCFSYTNYPQDSSLRFAFDNIKENTQYTFTLEYAFSFEDKVSYSMPWIRVVYTDGTYDIPTSVAYSDKFTQVKFTTAKDKTVVGIRTAGFGTVATVYVKTNMQIEEGTESTELVSYVDLSDITITRTGRNVSPVLRELSFPKDNGYSVNCNIPLPFAFKCTVEVEAAPNYPNASLVQFNYSDGTVEYLVPSTWNLTEKGTFTNWLSKSKGTTLTKISFPNYSELQCKIYDISIELGTSEPQYIPRIEPIIYTADENGIIENVKSVYPATVLYSHPDVVIDVEYNRDINIAIADIVEEYILKVMIGTPTMRTTTLFLFASEWSGSDGVYSQTVTLDNVTPYSKIDLQPSAEQLRIFHEKDIAFVVENDNGVITVYCIGQKPANDYIMQATITEVKVDE